MRGKACTCGTVHGKNRITPAYAGKRYLSRIGDALMGDHPRLCGEKHRRHGCYMITKGSPPPMRGKVLESLDSGIPVGITPAYAGKRYA